MYLPPHIEKLAAQSLHLAVTFRSLSKLNNPKRHGQQVADINEEVLLSLVDAVNSHLEKSFVTRTNFKPVKNVLDNIIEICMKYNDYLTENKHIQVEYRANDEEEPQHKKAIFQLTTLENLNTYKVERDRNAIVSLKEALEDKNFYEPVSADIKTFTSQLVLIFISRNAEVIDMFLFVILKSVNTYTILFTQYYEGSHGNRHFMWRENPDSDEQLTD